MSIIAFEELPAEDRSIYVIDEELPSKSDVAEAMPDTIRVRLDHGQDTVEIPVDWDCDDAEYAHTRKVVVVFPPLIDKEKYTVSDAENLPEIEVRIRARETENQEISEQDLLLGAEGKTGASVTRSTNETAIYNYLRNKRGLSCAGTAALMGNLYVECSFNPAAYNAGENAWGICQWRFERLENLQKRYPTNWKTLEAQLDFLYDEFEGRGDYMGPDTYEELQNSEDSDQGVRDAAVYFARWFERCSSASYQLRADYGVDFHQAYHKEPEQIVTPAEPELKLENRSTGVYLSWEKAENASGYRLYRRKESESGWGILQENTTAAAFLDTTAEAGISYVYTIRSYSGKYEAANAARIQQRILERMEE